MEVECHLCGFTHLSCINKSQNRIKKSFLKGIKLQKWQLSISPHLGQLNNF